MRNNDKQCVKGLKLNKMDDNNNLNPTLHALDWFNYVCHS